MFIDRIELTFDAAHRLVGDHGKCASPHGHTFRAEVFVAVRDLDALGMGVDFRELKGRLKGWIDAHWDHAFLAGDGDTALIEALRSVPESRLYLFRGVNPSTEALARELFGVAAREFGTIVERVRVWESPTQYAEYIPDFIPLAAATARPVAARPIAAGSGQLT
ncbi:MAG: 6-carboxytetrahydropterin synthase [Chloroflexota bacterium]|nr:6-carboxytetrahydropterin synthase [Chloroflexota bacterium]